MAGAALRGGQTQDGGGQQAAGVRDRRAPRCCPTTAAPRPANGWRNRARSCMLLPGPPHELKSMFERHCLPRIARIAPRQVIRTLVSARGGDGRKRPRSVDRAGLQEVRESRQPRFWRRPATCRFTCARAARPKPRRMRCWPKSAARSSCCSATASIRATAIRCRRWWANCCTRWMPPCRWRRAPPAACWASASPARREVRRTSWAASSPTAMP